MLSQINLAPVNPRQNVTLPDPWPYLIHNGFHRDLVLRAKAFAAFCIREGCGELGSQVLSLIGKGFICYDIKNLRPSSDDQDWQLKISFLKAIDELSEEFQNRVSNVVWQTLAFLGTRPNPCEEATIPSQKHLLPVPWPMADTVLHALPKVYGLNFHIMSRIYQKTGMVLEHNCDCNHSLKSPNGGSISIFLPKERHKEATAALLSHLLSESLLIYHLGLPFNLGLSPEALEAAA